MDNQEERTENSPPTGNDNADAKDSSSSMPQHESTSPASRMGFREFVPGADHDPADSDHESDSVDIPEFDLNQQMMASQRRQASTKRRGPGQQINNQGTEETLDDSGEPDTTPGDRVADRIERTSIRTTRPTQRKHPLIAEIVRRDIERLCRPRS